MLCYATTHIKTSPSFPCTDFAANLILPPSPRLVRETPVVRIPYRTFHLSLLPKALPRIWPSAFLDEGVPLHSLADSITLFTIALTFQGSSAARSRQTNTPTLTFNQAFH